METIYDVCYFINKFESIPADQWTTGQLSNNIGQHCALGHLNVEHYVLTEEAECLLHILRKYYNDDFQYDDSRVVYYINDGIDGEGSSPKERIINALLKVKSLQEEEAAVKQAIEIINNPIEEEVCV